MTSGNFRLAGDPRIKIRVTKLDQPLVLIQFPLAQLLDMGVGELSHDEVHLAVTAMPRAEQDPPPPRIEPVA